MNNNKYANKQAYSYSKSKAGTKRNKEETKIAPNARACKLGSYKLF